MNQHHIFGIAICTLIFLLHLPYFIFPVKNVPNSNLIMTMYVTSFMLFNVIVLYKDLMININNEEDLLDLMPFYMVAIYFVCTHINVGRSIMINVINNNGYFEFTEPESQNINNIENIKSCCSKISPYQFSLAIITLFGIYTGLVTYNISCYIDDSNEEHGICFAWANAVALIASLSVLIQYIVLIKMNKTDLMLSFTYMQWGVSIMIMMYMADDESVEYSTVAPFFVMVIMTTINNIVNFVRKAKYESENNLMNNFDNQ